MSFIPTLFIGIGKTHAYFTLRETYLTAKGVESSFHHFNLSQQANEAIEKAWTFADEYGLELRYSSNLEEEMRDVQRRSAEQRAADEAAEQATQAERAAYLQQQLQEQMAMIAHGVYPIGQYRGQEFREVPVSYINWLMSSIETFDEGSVIRALAEAVRIKCTDLILPVPDANATFGDIKSRYSIDVTVIKQFYYDKTDHFGRPCRGQIVQMVTDGGALLVDFGGIGKGYEVGGKYHIKGTVVSHGMYNSQAQTIINRVVIK